MDEKKFEKAIVKTTSTRECSPDPKHARRAIEGASDSLFFRSLTKRPMDNDAIVCFKGLLMTHGLLRLGKYSCMQAGVQFVDWFESLQRVWSNKTKNLKGYGQAISQYCRVIIQKINFHQKCPLFDGRFSTEFYVKAIITTAPDVENIVSWLTQMKEFQVSILGLYGKIRESSYIHGQNDLRGTAIIQLLLESSACFSAQISLMEQIDEVHQKRGTMDDEDEKRFRGISADVEKLFSQLRAFYREASQIPFVVKNISISVADLLPGEIPKIRKPTGATTVQPAKPPAEHHLPISAVDEFGFPSSVASPAQSPIPIHGRSQQTQQGMIAQASHPAPTMSTSAPSPNHYNLRSSAPSDPFQSSSAFTQASSPPSRMLYQPNQNPNNGTGVINTRGSNYNTPTTNNNHNNSNQYNNINSGALGEKSKSQGVTVGSPQPVPNRNSRRTVTLGKLPPIQADSFINNNNHTNSHLSNSPAPSYHEPSSSYQSTYAGMSMSPPGPASYMTNYLEASKLSKSQDRAIPSEQNPWDQVQELLLSPVLQSLNSERNKEMMKMTNGCRQSVEQLTSLPYFNSQNKIPNSDPLKQLLDSVHLSLNSLILYLRSDYHLSCELAEAISHGPTQQPLGGGGELAGTAGTGPSLTSSGFNSGGIPNPSDFFSAPHQQQQQYQPVLQQQQQQQPVQQQPHPQFQ